MGVVMRGAAAERAESLAAFMSTARYYLIHRLWALTVRPASEWGYHSK